MGARRDVVVALLLLMAMAVLSYSAVASGFARGSLRPLGAEYLERAASTPEVVTAIVWNYRGFDTLFETFVFFLAIAGTLSVLRLSSRQEREVRRSEEREPHRKMDEIVRVITKLVVVAIVAVSASIAIHGQLTPGGGFQAGSAMAVASLLLFVVFSKFVLERSGLTLRHTLTAYAAGLAVILVTVFLPVLMGGHLLQIDLLPGESGLLSLDVGEYTAVTFGFLSVFLVLGISEWIFKGVLREEVK